MTTDSGRGIGPVLVNFHEKVTDRLLTSAATDHGDRLLTKVRLADAIHVDHLTAHHKRYGLCAHLDFLMVDNETSMPRFAVELDGKHHWNDAATRERDRLKDALCKQACLPLLRITSDFTHQRGRWKVLSYIVDAFYKSEAFFEAQDNGYIPLDEPFDAGNFIITNESGGLSFNTLDADTRLRLLRHYEAKRLPSFAPDEFLTEVPAYGMVQAHAFMAVAFDRYLVARVQVRDFLFQGITPSEIAGQLATAELGDLADRWLAGEGVACDGRELTTAMSEVQQAIDAGGFLGSFTGGSLEAGGPITDKISIKFRA